jgi:uracil phosphoribosyltransferase
MLEAYSSRADNAYRSLPPRGAELEHAYGPQVHVLADPYLLTQLATLCESATVQPRINAIIAELYQHLIKEVLNAEFPREHAQVTTRMAAHSPFGTWEGQALKREVAVVCVDILRAGILPSQVCFDTLNRVLDPSMVHQDHLVVSRTTDNQGRVTGAHISASKIGGTVDDAFVLFPDPMGATGGSLCEALRYYKDHVPGKARRYIALNLIITPQYLQRIYSEHPDVVVYALRLDRGASPIDVLLEKPGVRWSEESGLTDKQYIVPGGGGFGEIMNNTEH